MKQFKSILKFELFTYITAKAYIIFTLFLVFVMALVLFSPRYLPFFIGEDSIFAQPESESQQEVEDSDDPVKVESGDTIYIATTMENSEDFYNYLSEELEKSGLNIVKKDCGVEELSDFVLNGECSKAMYFDSLNKFDYIAGETELYDMTSKTVYDIFVEYNKISTLASMLPEGTDIDSVLNPVVETNYIELGINQMDNFLYTYILIFILYMAVLVYGQFVITSIVTEKTSRAMEVLITSAKPNTFIMAKIIGAGLAGLIQLSTILLSAFVFYNINLDVWADNEIINSIFNIPSHLIAYMLIFFVLGYFIYAFLFGAVGSLASRMEDVSSLMTPVMLLFIVSFYITVIGLSSGSINSTIMVVASYVPFTSSMAMFTRIAMTDIAISEILISIGILIVSTFVIGFLAAKIYRMGVLFYGNKPKFKDIVKIIFSK